MRNLTHVWTLVVSTLGLLGTLAEAAMPPPPDRATWEQVDIVPMPKRIRLTGRSHPVAGAILVLGVQACEQERIGAKWINDHVAKLGGDALRVTHEGPTQPAARLRIYVGTRDTCEAVRQAVGAREFELGPGTPGKHGYVIHSRRQGDSTEVWLAGVDPVGALYACVTMAGLLEVQDGRILLREAEVVNWPDYLAVTEDVNLYCPERNWVSNTLQWRRDPPEDLCEEYVARMKEHLHRLLGWKVSCYYAREVMHWRRWGELSPQKLAAIREVAEYAKARGIRSLAYAFGPFVGRIEDYPDAPIRCATAHNGRRWKGKLRCWSMDDRRRQTAKRLAQMLSAAGITDVGFHDTDTGGFLSPAQWETRCDVCRKRWGDDYAAATINKHRIYYDEIKRAAPDCRIHFTLYPYNVSVMTQAGAERYHIDRYGPSPSIPDVAKRVRERFTDFWVSLTKGIPADATFCIRENVQENVKRFQQITAPHGTFIWYKSGSEQWQTFFDESARWIPTFHGGAGDIEFTVTLQTFMPLKAMAVWEYAWNVNAPGAAPWSRSRDAEERWRHSEPKGEIYDVVLPHLVRNLFGRRAAPEIVEALRCNMAYNQIFDSRHRMKPVLTTYEKMQWQADEAARGAAALDQLFERYTVSTDRFGMDDYASRRFVYLREVFHCSKWMAQARAQNLLAREQAKAGKLDEARATVERGRDAIADAREDLDRLLVERPHDPIYNAPLRGNAHKRRWRLYTPVWGVDFSTPEKVLAQTEKELPALAAAGSVSPKVIEELSKRQTVHAAPRTAELVIDGRLDESDWRRPLPAEALLVYPEQKNLARAHTRARLLYDDEKLYVGYTCWMPAHAAIKAEPVERDGDLSQHEHVELFLMPPHLKGGYLHFIMTATGSVSDKRVTFSKNPDGAQAKHLEPDWDVEGMTVQTTRREGVWELEIALPRSALGASDWRGRWSVNVGRYFIGAGNSQELSAIMRPGGKSFHATRYYPRLVYEAQPAPPPAVQIALKDVMPRVQTMDDRVATVVDFGLEARASRILHNVQFVAECYDATGKLHSRQVVKELAHLVFVWKAPETFSVGFEREVAQGGVKVLLVSDEVQTYRWIRLGGWLGTEKVGSVFSAGERELRDDDFRTTPGLMGLCVLPGMVTPPGSEQGHRIMNHRQGTLEFWFKPQWEPPHRLDERAGWQPTYTLLHCGILRRDHPWLANQSSFVLSYDQRRGNLHYHIRDARYAGWGTYVRARQRTGWHESGWHHLACVWDAAAGPDGWLRLYLDGTRAPTKSSLYAPDRLGEDKSVDLGKVAFAPQLLGFNTGRHAPPMLLDELRVSRTARYHADFSPGRAPLKLDKDTTALFHFDRTLDGHGMTPDGRSYRLQATPGPLEFH